MKNSVKENAIELGLDDLKAISGGISPKTAESFKTLMRASIMLQVASSPEEMRFAARTYLLAMADYENELIASENNP